MVNKILATLGMVALLAASNAAALEYQWELIVDNDDGLKVWTAERDGSNVRAFRGYKVLNAPIDKIVEILVNDDFQQKTEWIDYVAVWDNIDRSFGMGKNYCVFDMPWPVSDRDFVYQVKKDLDVANRSVIVSIDSVEHADYPAEKTVGVRGTVSDMHFLVKWLGPNKSELRIESHIDPKGWVPTWMVNYLNSAWPERTVSGLEKLSMHPDARSDQETYDKIVEPSLAADAKLAH